jgi:hypothetical protein
MKHHPPNATWEAKSNGRRYLICYEENYPNGLWYCVSITKEDGRELPGKHWEHYDRYGTLRGATKFCRNAYFDKLQFKRIA